MSESAISAFATLIVILDPVGLVPIFLSLTAEMTAGQRRQTAFWAAVLACVILVFFALLGDALLDYLGITVPAFRIAGGLMLFYTAFEMVFEQRRARNRVGSLTDGSKVKTVAAFPLAVPLMAGPGAITASILLAGSAQGQIYAQMELMLVIAAACAISFLCFVSAEPIDRLLGTTGKVVLTRILGILLAALAIQFVADGVLTMAGAANHLKE